MENYEENKIVSVPSKTSIAGKILIGTSAAAAVGISVICFPFISPAFRKFTLPYIPATNNQLKNILSVLPKNTAQNKLLDIGSGDGRIVIEAAKVSYSFNIFLKVKISNYF